MSKTKKLTKKQWHSALKTDHNHQHSTQIDHQVEIISRDQYKRQSRTQHTSKSKQSHSKSPGRTKTSQSKKRKDSSVRSRSQSPDQLEIDQSQRTYKSKTSARSSSSKQSTCVPNVLLSRNVTPRIFPPGERCMITMMYFGSELKVEYDREWFEPDGEEIIVMQQHCGGGNLVAFKGFLKPKDIFSFESARQTDYPFALTCFINGTMYNRLSLCCESRCKNGMRIGGRHGMFCIIDVQKEKPCRRCRYEKRMKKLMEDDGKSSTSSERQLCPKSTKSSRLRSKSPAVREENSTSNTNSKKLVRSTTAPTTSKSVTHSKSHSRKNDTSKESSDSFDSDSSNGKPDATRKLNTDTPAPTSNPHDSDASVQELSHVRSSSSEAFTSHNPNPEGTQAYRKNSDSSDSESSSRKVPASRKLNANTPAPTSHQDDSDVSVQELSQFRSSSSEAFTFHNSNPKETRTSEKDSNSSDSDSSSGKPVTSRKLNDNTTRTLTPLPHSDSLNTSPQRQSPLRTSSPDSEERPQSPRKLMSTQQTNSNGKYNTISSLVQKLGNNDSSTASHTNDNEPSSSPSSTISNTGRNTTNDQVYPWMNHQRRQSDEDNQRDADDSDNDNKDYFK